VSAGEGRAALSRFRFRAELLSWSLLAIALGAADGGVVGVMLKALFTDAVDIRTLNYSVALILGAPHFCNLLGFLWPRLSRGRNVARMLVRIQVATALCLLLVAVAPLGSAGLVSMLAGALGARFFWSGVVTLRAPIWRSRYPAHMRARLIGIFFSVHSVVMALTALAVSALLDWNRSAYPAIFTVAAALGVAGAVVFRSLRVPASVSVFDEPVAPHDRSAPSSWRLLRHDRSFARYLFWLSTVHIGNLMLMAPLIVVMTDRLHMAQRAQVVVTSFIPLLLVPLTTSAWGRLFDRGGVLRFQALNAAAFTLAALALLIGAVTTQVVWLWLGAVLLGVAYAGGSIGWHLGHNHFSPRSQTLEYMGLHVTMSGVRGLVAPFAGMMVYERVEALAPGRGAWALLVPVMLCAIGGLGFARLAATEPLPDRERSEEMRAAGARRRAGHLAVLLAVALGALGARGRAVGTDAFEDPTAAGSERHAQGYLMYCPCMGRFGNQVDQLLGAMAAARASGRTLVLPPFIEYQGTQTQFVPFEKYFSVAAVRELVPAVTMEEFMTDPALAASLWPAAQRRIYCPRDRGELGCRMPSGNPQKTFWDHYGIVFVGSVAGGATMESLASELPPQQHRVIALADSPGSYPVAAENRDLQRYLRWSDEVRTQGEAFLEKRIARPLLAVHIRNGTDWQQACRTAAGRRQFMSSPQCGLSDTAGSTITQAMCLPGPDEVVRSIRLAQERFGPFRSVFIGTDADDYRPQIEAALADDIRVVRGGAPQLDLYVFGQADLFIGNCISSFTAFAVRERRVNGRRSMFFGLEPPTESNAAAAESAK